MTENISPEKLFEDIAPYSDDVFHEKIKSLVKEPGFEHAVKWVLPEIDYNGFADQLLQVTNGDSFQRNVMMPFLEMLTAKTTSGLSCEGLENINPGKAYTFITNHRDIVLDTSLLNLSLLRAGYPSTEVAIGSNLLIYSWINDLVRLNKSFIVKRDLPITKALEAARELSAYIHYAIGTKNQSVWIAERQGRSKDSSDMAQDSLIKMLGLEGGGDIKSNIMAINLLPVSISYEYDPNDCLKAKEFLMRRDNPDFKKSQRDDLLAMETGLLQPKGHVHFTIGKPLNPLIDQIDPELDKNSMVREVCEIIDCQIHSGYKIFPCNYIAYDLLNGTDEFRSMYTDNEYRCFLSYIDKQLEKDDVAELAKENRDFLYKSMLTMYANPLKNNIMAKSNQVCSTF